MQRHWSEARSWGSMVTSSLLIDRSVTLDGSVVGRYVYAMPGWPPHPTVYEINTWVWLNALSRASRRSIDLANVPDDVLDRIADHRFDAVWLMGVWQRSVGAREVSRTVPGLLDEYRRALPDGTLDDVVGSPYAVAQYRVDPAIGGDDGLAILRKRLASRGLRVILDFVPNHL